jgi:hypothetical protein
MVGRCSGRFDISAGVGDFNDLHDDVLWYASPSHGDRIWPF